MLRAVSTLLPATLRALLFHHIDFIVCWTFVQITLTLGDLNLIVEIMCHRIHQSQIQIKLPLKMHTSWTELNTNFYSLERTRNACRKEKNSVQLYNLHPCFRERPFNLKGGGGGYGFFLKEYSDSQCC